MNEMLSVSELLRGVFSAIKKSWYLFLGLIVILGFALLLFFFSPHDFRYTLSFEPVFISSEIEAMADDYLAELEGAFQNQFNDDLSIYRVSHLGTDYKTVKMVVSGGEESIEEVNSFFSKSAESFAVFSVYGQAVETVSSLESYYFGLKKNIPVFEVLSENDPGLSSEGFLDDDLTFSHSDELVHEIFISEVAVEVGDFISNLDSDLSEVPLEIAVYLDTDYPLLILGKDGYRDYYQALLNQSEILLEVYQERILKEWKVISYLDEFLRLSLEEYGAGLEETELEALSAVFGADWQEDASFFDDPLQESMTFDALVSLIKESDPYYAIVLQSGYDSIHSEIENAEVLKKWVQILSSFFVAVSFSLMIYFFFVFFKHITETEKRA